MSKFILVCLLGSLVTLTACQSTAKQYNGISGYQIERQDQHTATLSYTLAGHTTAEKDQNKLQRACQQVLGSHKTYKIQILSQNEIANPPKEQIPQGVNIGQSGTSFGLSNTPNLNNSENYAARQGLEVSPRTLKVIHYTCQ